MYIHAHAYTYTYTYTYVYIDIHMYSHLHAAARCHPVFGGNCKSFAAIAGATLIVRVPRRVALVVAAVHQSDKIRLVMAGHDLLTLRHDSLTLRHDSLICVARRVALVVAAAHQSDMYDPYVYSGT